MGMYGSKLIALATACTLESTQMVHNHIPIETKIVPVRVDEKGKPVRVDNGKLCLWQGEITEDLDGNEVASENYTFVIAYRTIGNPSLSPGGWRIY